MRTPTGIIILRTMPELTVKVPTAAPQYAAFLATYFGA